MTPPLYTRDVLRLAASIPHHERLSSPMASADKRSVTCGSRVIIDANVDSEGRVSELGMQVSACALGQASAALFGRNAMGRTAVELLEARDGLTRWLANEGAMPDWPGIEIFEAALVHRGRHPAIRLPFEVGAEAAQSATAALADLDPS